jgi:hypothetical protein
MLAAAMALGASGCQAQVTYVTAAPEGGAAATTGDGGVGGAADGGRACASLADCPVPEGPCVLATCEGGACGTRFAARGSVVAPDGPADCRATTCDGAGNTEHAADPTNVPAAVTACATPTCANDGTLGATMASAGTACTAPGGGQKCDGAGACVECLATADCTAGAVCVKTRCVWSCIDGIQDGAETDVDCGGASCAPCANGKTCAQGVDCASSACDPKAHVCADASCTDARQDGAETDVDCGGGTCGRCATGEMCKTAADCVSNVCDGLLLRCATSACADHTQDGSETDVDCGGGACLACADLQRCLVDTDCASGHCDPRREMCLPTSCTDNAKDGSETDVDCGGVCEGCGFAKSCNASADCLSSACDGITSTCDFNPCADHRRDNQESDVDCGGPVCGPCLVGKKCNTNGDCAPGHICNGLHVCQ